MIQFNQDEICELIRACETYKEKTGSEYMWDKYELLQVKLKAYGEEVSTEDNLNCQVNK